MREKRASKGKKASIISIGLYHFHNLLVKGTFARIVAFSIVALVICLVLGLVLSFVPGSDGSMLTSIWNTTLCMLDGGTIAGMEAGSEQTGALFVVTLFGIVFTSVLVGIITTGIEERLEEIAHEGSKVLERRSHVLVLGCAPVTAEILRSLAQNNESGKHVEPVVVLEENRDIVELSKELDHELRAYHKTKTIYRQGCPYDESDLSLCSIENARAILITAQSDNDAVKSVLVCITMMEKIGHEIPVFVVCQNEDDFSLLRREAGGLLYLFCPDRVLDRAVEGMQEKCPALLTCVAGDAVEVSDDISRLLITDNDRVGHHESDDLVIRTLIGLHPLCEQRRAEGNPLEIACMLYFDKNVEPAKCLGVDETVLVGRLLADRIGIHIERA